MAIINSQNSEGNSWSSSCKGRNLIFSSTSPSEGEASGSNLKRPATEEIRHENGAAKKTKLNNTEQEEQKPARIINGVRTKAKSSRKSPKITSTYSLKDFSIGDIVWAKAGGRSPSWPAIVIDPTTHGPRSLWECHVNDSLCVMYFGYSKQGTRREYSWVKNGMIYPFAECSGWFKDQPHKNEKMARRFNEAMNEASMIDQGIIDKGRLLECSSSKVYGVNCGEGSHSSQVQVTRTRVRGRYSRHF